MCDIIKVRLKVIGRLFIGASVLCCFFCQSPVKNRLNDTLPNDTLPNDTLPNDTLPNDTLPNDTLPNDTLPNDTLPNDTLPNDTLPNDTLPNDTIPNDTIPNDTIPNDTIPNDTIAEFDKIVIRDFMGLKVGNSWEYRRINNPGSSVLNTDTNFLTIYITVQNGSDWYVTQKDSIYTWLSWRATFKDSLDSFQLAYIKDSILTKPEYQSFSIDSIDTFWIAYSPFYHKNIIDLNRIEGFSGFPITTVTCDTCTQEADSFYCKHGSMDWWFQIRWVQAWPPAQNMTFQIYYQSFQKNGIQYATTIKKMYDGLYCNSAIYFQNTGMAYFRISRCGGGTNIHHSTTISLLKFNSNEIPLLNEAINSVMPQFQFQ